MEFCLKDMGTGAIVCSLLCNFLKLPAVTWQSVVYYFFTHMVILSPGPPVMVLSERIPLLHSTFFSLQLPVTLGVVVIFLGGHTYKGQESRDIPRGLVKAHDK